MTEPISHHSGRLPADIPEDMAFWVSFLRAYKLVTGHVEEAIAQIGNLTLVDFEVLLRVTLHHGGSARMKDIGDFLLVSNSRVTRVVDRLVEAGYLRREIPEQDRREVLAIVTDKGNDIIAEAGPVFQNSLSQVFGLPLNDTERSQFLVLLRKLIEANQSETQPPLATED